MFKWFIFSWLLRYPDPEGRILNRVFSDTCISVVPRETTLTISDSIKLASPGDFEKVRVISRRPTEIKELSQFKKKEEKKKTILRAVYLKTRDCKKKV